MPTAVDSSGGSLPIRIVAVAGGNLPTPQEAANAREVGRLLAGAGMAVATGGRGGVMEEACRGAFEAGGLTVGILPGGGPDETPPNRYVRVAIFTGLGDARNAVLVRTARALVAVGGSYGTLSEIGLALKAGRPVVLLGSWSIAPPSPIAGCERLLFRAATPEEAAATAIRLALQA